MPLTPAKPWIALLACLLPALAQGSPALGEYLRDWFGQRLSETFDAELEAGRARWHGLYAARGFEPLWFDAGGATRQARVFAAYLADGDRLGAGRPLDIPALPPTADFDIAEAARSELRLTATLLSLAEAVHRGQTDPAAVDPAWHHRRAPLAAETVVGEVARGDRVERVLERIAPGPRGYRRLLAALADYRAVARIGGWPRLPAGPALRHGGRDGRVPLLRERLALSRDLRDPYSGDTTRYDRAVADAVRHFQRRHGLAADGVLGPETLAALNVSVEQRIDQIRATLERWRWLPRPADGRFVLVNVAGFDVTLYEEGEPGLTMRTVVGRPDEAWRTPSFVSEVHHVILNPSWYIPETIARAELLPRWLEDPGYLERRGIRAYREGEAVTLNRAQVREALAGDRLPFLLRQAPGPDNALGRVKVMLPNRFDVYLHDTPERHLFSRRDRALSHGCIRLEEPFALAAALLGDAWDEDRLRDAAAGGTPQKIPLSAPVPIYFAYLTVWVDAEGAVQFRDDIYGRNAKLIAALKQGRTGLAAVVN